MDHVLKKGIWKRLLALLLCVLLIGGTMDAAAFADAPGDDAPAGDDAPGVPPVDGDADDPADGDAPASPERGGAEQGEAEGSVPSDDAGDADDPTDGDAPASPERGGAEQGEAEGSASSDDDTDAPDDGDAPASPERGGAEQSEAEGSASSDDADASVGDDAPGVPPADDESAEKTVVYRFVVDGATVAEQTVKDGDTLDKPADPVKEGYTFLGWFIGETQLFVTDADNDGVIDPETVRVTENSEDVTVTAVFEEIAATPSNADASVGDDAPSVLPADADDGAPASPERGGAEQGEAEGSDPSDDEDGPNPTVGDDAPGVPSSDDNDASGEGGPKRGPKKSPENGDRTVLDSGSCGAEGDNLTWTLYDDGELIISGTGAMASYNNNFEPHYKSGNTITAVIEDGVTSIGDGAFFGCGSLTTITIPDSVTSIGNFAFDGCSSLTSITIPSGVTSIGFAAFIRCPTLNTISVSENNPGYCSINGVLCSADGKTLCAVPGAREGAFVIPEGVTSVGSAAFASCSFLREIVIPDGVQTIADSAFGCCSSLESITIPDSITGIHNSAFGDCGSLTEVNYGGSEAEWEILYGGAPNDATMHYGKETGTTVIDSGTCGESGDNLSWTLYLDGRLVISGSGAMANNCTWNSNRQNIRKVIIEDGVTSIGNYAFGGSWNEFTLDSVSIPSSVTSIGSGAFYGCHTLCSITIPDSVKTIGSYSFAYCYSLQSVMLSKTLTSMYAGSFYYCYSLESITIPDTVTTIDSDALTGCSGLTDIYYGGAEAEWRNLYGEGSPNDATMHYGKETGTTVLGTGNCGANGSNLSWTLYLDGRLIISGSGAMADYSSDNTPWYDHKYQIRSVKIQSGATSIGSNAFSDCNALTSITIPSGVTSIGYFAFGSCSSLTSVTIPASVTSIGSYAFSDCSALTSLTIPSSVTSIGSYAFYDCSSLTSITIPDSVTSIGYEAFYCCSALTEVNYGGSEAEWRNLYGEGAPNDATMHYGKETGTTVLGTGSCGANGSNLSFTLYLDGRLVISGSGAMADYGGDNAPWYDRRNQIRSVTIQSGATSIGSYAFYDCSALTSLTIPDSVTSIGSYAFYGCDALTEVNYGGSEAEWRNLYGEGAPNNATMHYGKETGTTVLGTGSCGANGSNLSFTLYLDGRLIISGSGAMADYGGGNAPWYDRRNQIRSVTIQSGATSIGDGMFSGCSALTSVTIPSGVTSIAPNAFSGCSALTSVTIPASVTFIGDYAFHCCSVLTEVNYGGSEAEWRNLYGEGAPNNATMHYGKETGNTVLATGNCGASGSNLNYKLYLDGRLIISGSGAMADYNSNSAPWSNRRSQIRSATIQSGATSIGSYAFYGCSSLTNVTIKSGVTSIGGDAFAGCSALTSVTIPASVTSIGGYAFESCSSLTSVTIPSGVTSIGGGAFNYCSALTSFTFPTGMTSLDNSYFYGCSSLTSITIPAGVTSIGNVFNGCDALTDVYYGGSEAEWETLYGSAPNNAAMHYGKETGTTVVDSGSCGASGDNLSWTMYLDGRLVISGSGTMANYNTGSAPWYNYRDGNNNYRIRSVTIQSGVTSIGTDAFYNCVTLTSVSIGPDVKTIGEEAFRNCGLLSGVTIPNSVRTIGEWAFKGCSALADATLGSGLRSIGTGAFWACSSLSSITIPASVTSIGEQAFDGCQAMTEILVAADNTKYSSKNGVLFDKGQTTLIRYPGGKSGSYSIPTTVTALNALAFSGCSSLTSVTVPESVDSVGYGVFSNCSALAGVSLPSGFRFIQSGLFYNCSSLTSITIPKYVVEIGSNAFSNCNALTVVSLPQSLQIIDPDAFSGCGGLDSVYYAGSEEEWQNVTVNSGNEMLLGADFIYAYAAKPVIKAQPRSVTKPLNTTASFSVTAVGATSWQWQYRASSSDSWSNATADGCKTAVLNVPVTSARNGYQYRCVLKNDKGTTWSSAATLKVLFKPTITTQPASVSVKEGETASFTVAATGASSWQWQYRSSGSGSWANATAEGNKTATLKVPATAARNGYQYRCAVKNAGGTSYSSAATLTVKLKPKITTQPKSVSAKEGATATFTVSATGATGWQWQYRSSSSGSWASATAEGNKTATLKVPATAARNGYQYRCKLSNANGTTWSSAATLTVKLKPVITIQPKSTSVNEGGTAIFTVTATGATSWQWQYRSSGTASWASATADGCKSSEMRVPATAARNGYQYRCAVKNAGGTVYSNVVTLTVKLKPVITTQPASVSVKEGGTATFTVAADGATGWQWQYRSSGSAAWANATAEGNKTATLSVPASAARNGYQYRCQVKNAGGTTSSSAATLTVLLKPVITVQPVSVTQAVSTTAYFTVTATGATSWQWQFRSSSSGSWYNATGEGCSSATLVIPVTAWRDGYQYRCLVKNDNGTRYSDVATLTVR